MISYFFARWLSYWQPLIDLFWMYAMPELCPKRNLRLLEAVKIINKRVKKTLIMANEFLNPFVKFKKL